jgi:HEPN domain-containing protein
MALHRDDCRALLDHKLTEPLGWIARAAEDFTQAHSALRRKKPLLYGATFHAQQCVEKYIKALLVARGLAFPRTHDLVL